MVSHQQAKSVTSTRTNLINLALALPRLPPHHEKVEVDWATMGVCTSSASSVSDRPTGRRVLPLADRADDSGKLQIVELEARDLLVFEEDLSRLSCISGDAAKGKEEALSRLRQCIDAVASTVVCKSDGVFFFRERRDRVRVAFLLGVGALIEDGLLKLAQDEDNVTNVTTVDEKNMRCITVQSLREAWKEVSETMGPMIGKELQWEQIVVSFRSGSETL